MNILNIYVFQCILCASEQTFFRIYGALQIKLLLLLLNQYCYELLNIQWTHHSKTMDPPQQDNGPTTARQWTHHSKTMDPPQQDNGPTTARQWTHHSKTMDPPQQDNGPTTARQWTHHSQVVQTVKSHTCELDVFTWFDSQIKSSKEIPHLLKYL